LISKSVNTTATLNALEPAPQNVDKFLEFSTQKYNTEVILLERIINLRYEIRKLISNANETSNISDLMNSKKRYETLLSFTDNIIQQGETRISLSSEAINCRLEQLKNTNDDFSGLRQYMLSVSILNDEEILDLRVKASGYKKYIRALDSQLGQLNLSITINLKDDLACNIITDLDII